MGLSPSAFRTIVYRNYKKYGRDFPWRHTKNPYHIFVSEIMLQQTQADRVIEKYKQFLKTFPTIQKLGDATTKKIYGTWKGLGYNRRALSLKRTAQIIAKEHDGKIPNQRDVLEGLPGIGPYTASAILVFAFKEAVPVIETNIRTVYIYHFFKNRKEVTDKEILLLIEKNMDRINPSLWYTALMDYGAFLKKSQGNFSKKSITYAKQTPFKGSRREVRGKILKQLSTKSFLTKTKINKILEKDAKTVASVLLDLEKEGFIKKHKDGFKLT